MANDGCSGYNALRYKFVEDITEWQVFNEPKLFKFLENVAAIREETTESMVLAPYGFTRIFLTPGKRLFKSSSSS